MGYSVLNSRYRLNGIIDTSQPILANMEKIANSAAAWISYDMFEGKWDVVINKAENPVAFFDDNNIIGSIQLDITSLKETYNSVEVRFQHPDLNEKQDYLKISIPEVDRLANEPDNMLSLKYDTVNDPVQANFLGLIELKQSRLDKVITFTADYSYISLSAGAVIAVTNSLFGWTNKEFRIITITEISNDTGLSIQITALEYDDNVYSTDDLHRYIRSNQTGITSIGAIGAPQTPQITKIEVDARPRIIIDTAVPNGIVNKIEYWISYNVPPGITEDSLRTYTKLGESVAPNGTNFVSGDPVSFEADNISTSSFLIKAKAFNGSTSGPFSVVSSVTSYGPVQATGTVVAPNVTVLDANNQPVSGSYSMADVIALSFASKGQQTLADISAQLGVLNETITTESGVPAGTGVLVDAGSWTDYNTLSLQLNSFSGPAPDPVSGFTGSNYPNWSYGPPPSAIFNVDFDSKYIEFKCNPPWATWDYKYVYTTSQVLLQPTVTMSGYPYQFFVANDGTYTWTQGSTDTLFTISGQGYLPSKWFIYYSPQLAAPYTWTLMRQGICGPTTPLLSMSVFDMPKGSYTITFEPSSYEIGSQFDLVGSYLPQYPLTPGISGYDCFVYPYNFNIQTSAQITLTSHQ